MDTAGAGTRMISTRTTSTRTTGTRTTSTPTSGGGTATGTATTGGTTGSGTRWRLLPAAGSDVERIAELRAVVMRPDLERLGRYDETRVRQRLRDSFAPEHTWLVEADGAFAGSVTLRPLPGSAGGCCWLENFYLVPASQGQGLGSAVLRHLLARTDAEGLSVRLDVLQGSHARRLYERHGFTLEREDPVDAFLIRLPRTSPRA